MNYGISLVKHIFDKMLYMYFMTDPWIFLIFQDANTNTALLNISMLEITLLCVAQNCISLNVLETAWRKHKYHKSLTTNMVSAAATLKWVNTKKYCKKANQKVARALQKFLNENEEYEDGNLATFLPEKLNEALDF